MAAVRGPVPLVTGRAPLLRALAHAFGSEREATSFLRDVLWDAGMDAVPEGRELYQAFVREEVLPRLMPLVRLDRLHDLVRRTIGEEGSLHPPPLKPYGGTPGTAAQPAVTRRARVVVVEPDSLRRIAVSRELVRAGFDVEALAAADEVLRVAAFHAVVMGVDLEGERVLAQLAAQGTRAGLVVFDDAAARAALKRTIDGWPHERLAIVGREASAATIAARVRVVVGT
jgi:hypothetical protein